MDLSLNIGPWSWKWSFGRRKPEKPIDSGAIEKQFHATSTVSRLMKDSIALWYLLYIDEPPWETDEVKSQGYPGVIVRELARCTLSESEVSVSGGERAEYLNDLVQDRVMPMLYEKLELCLALGGAAFKPYIDQKGELQIDFTSATGFTPTAFDGMGRAIAGVFRETATVDHQQYTRLEYHGWDENGRYTIENRAFLGDSENGGEVQLSAVPQWAGLQETTVLEGIEGPLFAYLKNPSGNRIEPESRLGVSVYGGKDNITLLQRIDRMASRMEWEYDSSERKIFTDGQQTHSDQFMDRLFERGMFTSTGELFQEFSPAIRDENYRQGMQDLLKQLEDHVGLSRGTISDPQQVQKSATEVTASKDKQRVTVRRIQTALETAIDGIVYAASVYCDLYGLAPTGEYEVSYSWGDGVIDDPASVAAEKAVDLQELSAGILNDYEYRMKWYGETEEEAKERLPKDDQLIDDDQNEIGGVQPTPPLEGAPVNQPTEGGTE